jgi:hypothetical protein
MATIDSTLGAKASTYGYYSQISSSTYSGSQLLAVLSDVVSSGAVFQPAIMPSIPFSQVTSSVASQVASVLEQFTSQGVEVWLRFGHEMNWYVVSNRPKTHRQKTELIIADRWHILWQCSRVHHGMEEHLRRSLIKFSDQDVLVSQYRAFKLCPVLPRRFIRRYCGSRLLPI